MRAIVCTEFGGVDKLALQTLPDPQPGPGQIAITVYAAGVNFADILTLRGQYQVKTAPPFVPGLEVAGVVRAVGAGVSGLPIGARVLACCDGGAFAEIALADAVRVHHIPDAMDFTVAAGFVVAYGTAHLALSAKAALRPGEFLVVNGAAGGVGLTAVEVGKKLGAKVIALAAGPEKLAVAQRAGADVLIDYTAGDVTAQIKAATGGRGADVIYDPVGGAAFDDAFRAVARLGRILLIGFASGEVPQIPANILLVKNVTAIGYYWGAHYDLAPDLARASTEALIDWYGQGKLRPTVSRVLPLEQTAAAIEHLAGRRATGKVVVRVRDEESGGG